MTAHADLVPAVEALRAELVVHCDPHRRGFNLLNPNRQGCTAEPYTTDALRLWEGQFRGTPDDLATVHHLAVMYHARAFDREFAGDFAGADLDWPRALHLWHRLWSADEFWAKLAKRVDPGVPDPFPAVREAWPANLLRVHFDAALDESTPPARRGALVRVVLDSPFPAAVKEGVRKEAYERVIRRLPPEVWEGGTIDPTALAPALEAIERYLAFDPDFRQARVDLLDVLRRWQTGHVQRTNVADSADAERHLLPVLECGRRYDAHIRALEADADADAEVAFRVRVWHQLLGQANRILQDFTTSAAHYRRAWSAAEYEAVADREATARRLCGEWVFAVLLDARGHAQRGDAAGAKSLLAGVAAQQNLPGRCLLLRAVVHEALKDLAAAAKDCLSAKAALQEEARGADREAAAEATRVRAECDELAAHIQVQQRQQQLDRHLDAAVAACRTGRWDAARGSLDAAVALSGDDFQARFLRAQCCTEQYDFDGARADLRHAEKLAGGRASPDVLRALADARTRLAQLESVTNRSGGPAAFKHRREAGEAFQKGSYEKAAASLRAAIKALALPRLALPYSPLGATTNALLIPVRVVWFLLLWRRIRHELAIVLASDGILEARLAIGSAREGSWGAARDWIRRSATKFLRAWWHHWLNPRVVWQFGQVLLLWFRLSLSRTSAQGGCWGLVQVGFWLAVILCSALANNCGK